jgi:hypothetical protein
MNAVEQATATQLANIEKRTGKTLAELAAFLRASGLTRHSELRDLAKTELGLGHGDANTLVHYTLKSDGTSAAAEAGLAADEVLDTIYTGAKAPLRPIHDALVREIDQLGAYEVAPKKGYVSLRRKKQFAMIGPGTNSCVDLGLNMRGVPGTERLRELAAGGMCQYQVRLTSAEEVDAEVVGWIRTAFESAG